jgi:hypothetical protein
VASSSTKGKGSAAAASAAESKKNYSLNYNKWDNILDSDDEDDGSSQPPNRSPPGVNPAGMPQSQAELKVCISKTKVCISKKLGLCLCKC